MADDDRPIAALLRTAEAASERRRQEHLAAAGYPGIDGSLIPVLRAVADQETTMSALGDRLGLPLMETSRLLGLLEARDYVRRLGRPGDLRRRVARITDAGRAALHTDDQLAADQDRRLMDRLGAQDVTAARRVLDALSQMG
ncbi:MarR family transcriptional regulator [Actinoplanes sp. NBRC 103695]|uniref:MarR family winged helix-turn-helix transcriptional regulator n=1 Tax=Actinoplanes sp. NBRC 103695 TaxID=3032202 RepID=UPI0024A2CF1E|nr:MarR family transcriptional regulator [Actinoplanes sp. NBRC 103695]GLZ01580.1 hypothetical protein Acsp02_88310 [Actinoplanes sp. NBRC 103695]